MIEVLCVLQVLVLKRADGNRCVWFRQD